MKHTDDVIDVCKVTQAGPSSSVTVVTNKPNRSMLDITGHNSASHALLGNKCIFLCLLGVGVLFMLQLVSYSKPFFSGVAQCPNAVLSSLVDSVGVSMNLKHLLLQLTSYSWLELTTSQAVKSTTFSNGTSLTIPSWSIQPSNLSGNDISAISAIDYDASSWYHVGARSTVMAGLIEAGVYNDTDLFFSNALQDAIDASQLAVPWYYRQTFNWQLSHGTNYLLHTNGITSKADVYLNGKEVVNSTIQTGAYSGRIYNASSQMRDGDNVLLIRVYPTDYNRDLGVSFVDWNPSPPDNGTGIWRDIQIKQVGQVAATGIRIITDLTEPGVDSVNVTLKTDVRNFGNMTFKGIFQPLIRFPHGGGYRPACSIFTLDAYETQTVSCIATIDDPQIWWPKAWGGQPLYSVSNTIVSIHGTIEDEQPPRSFGIRHVTSYVNEHDDIMFVINGHPFQVLGAGYSPDMFLRFDEDKLTTQFKYMLDIGLNTVRLEGKQEQPELYDIADRLGVMVLAGWECCDKWEAWTYNEDRTAELWTDQDYKTARAMMRHEAAMMQAHPSMLGFLIGSDLWPDDRAARIYIDSLQRDMDWPNPIIASASKRGFPTMLGPSGMKMDGPYDWVSPNYWWYGQLGAAFGFGSELGPGAGTPEIGSLKKFLSEGDLVDLWTQPDKFLFHMSINASVFHDRSIYNEALWKRYGPPQDLDDYLLKAQMMDYEATRAQFEAYSALWSAERPATGMIYWMLNNAWPSLHWNLFDYYLHPSGSYFGAKAGSRLEHVVYDSVNGTLYLINRALHISGDRTVDIDLIDLNGTSLAHHCLNTTTEPNTSKNIGGAPDSALTRDVALLRLVLKDSVTQSVLSRNVYWLSSKNDVLDWDNSTWYNTPSTSFANFTALNNMKDPFPGLCVNATICDSLDLAFQCALLKIQNEGDIPAVFVMLNLVDSEGEDVTPVYWSDNYITIWPEEGGLFDEVMIQVEYPTTVRNASVQISGRNTGAMKTIPLL